MSKIFFRLPALIIVFILGAAAMPAQDMRSATPRQSRRTVARTPQERVVIEYDTVVSPAADSIAVDGFEKPLRSMRESMTVHNRTARPLVSVGLDMVYTDLSGRMIHRARHNVNAMIPPGESRRIDVPTFDSSASFYYRHSARPRYTSHATPFDVAVTVIYITQPILTDSRK